MKQSRVDLDDPAGLRRRDADGLAAHAVQPVGVDLLGRDLDLIAAPGVHPDQRRMQRFSRRIHQHEGLALMGDRDRHHAGAVALSRSVRGKIVITDCSLAARTRTGR